MSPYERYLFAAVMVSVSFLFLRIAWRNWKVIEARLPPEDEGHG